jgi:copper homeostasis protein
MLNKDGSIDKKRCSQLVSLAYPLGVSFHRAFDRCSNPFEALEDIIDIGCERILTSGQQPTVTEGADFINELIRQADDRLIIMPGSGVREDNIVEIAKKTGATEFHSSARKPVKSNMEFFNPGMNEELLSIIADAEAITQMKHLLTEYFQQEQ